MSTRSGMQLKELEPKKVTHRVVAKEEKQAKNDKFKSNENNVASVKPPLYSHRD